MRVYCRECGSKGRITKTNRLSRDYTELYCQCNDAECGHTWVVGAGYRHSLNPSAKTTTQMAFQLVKALPPGAQKDLLRELEGAR
ncbi:transcriptional regulator [Zobellella denitrificans]|uniref:ogr/Delta-like zinc finger family protein n=1 Tax=Zobellella denitrificans TaxID=347534 RepID=UPI000B8C2E16|nr:ogr/Delta-like zinc finger family protein [Zobellella denitrificans]OXS13814.1 transcriptional regulator [Zobellella denitrificans]